MNYLHSLRIRNKVRYQEKACKNEIFCAITLTTQKEIILKLNQNMKSGKSRCIIYADLESLIKKIDNRKNNSKKTSTAKIGEHIPCGISIIYIAEMIVWKMLVFF